MLEGEVDFVFKGHRLSFKEKNTGRTPLTFTTSDKSTVSSMGNLYWESFVF